jgi:hypothetical protein
MLFCLARYTLLLLLLLHRMSIMPLQSGVVSSPPLSHRRMTANTQVDSKKGKSIEKLI